MKIYTKAFLCSVAFTGLLILKDNLSQPEIYSTPGETEVSLITSTPVTTEAQLATHNKSPKTPVLDWANRETNVSIYDQSGNRYLEKDGRTYYKQWGHTYVKDNDFTFKVNPEYNFFTSEGQEEVVITHMTPLLLQKDQMAFWFSSF